jgi:cytochrome b561
MSETSEIAAAPAVAPASQAGRFDRLSIALHWLTVALIAGQLATAWLLLQATDGAALLLSVHRSMGLVTWLVVASRLVWVRAIAHPPPFPASLPKLQQLAAWLNEYGLYALLLAQPLTGLGDSLFRGKAIVLFGATVPALFDVNKAVFHACHAAHELGAVALLALIALHTGAALFHGLVRRDGVLQRMLPWTPS